VIKITEIAKGKLVDILKDNPGKYLRVIISGFG